MQLRSVTWEKLLEPEKKGQWWLPGLPSEGDNTAAGRAEVAGLLDGGAAEAEKMLQLAASQRMNTDARRALFCIVMSAEDYEDAFEKILRLKLPGKQVRYQATSINVVVSIPHPLKSDNKVIDAHCRGVHSLYADTSVLQTLEMLIYRIVTLRHLQEIG